MTATTRHSLGMVAMASAANSNNIAFVSWNSSDCIHPRLHRHQKSQNRLRQQKARQLNSLYQNSANGVNNESFGGTYIDLGRMVPQLDHISSNGGKTTANRSMEQRPKPFFCYSSTATTIEEWRSQHWIVLIDDESPIRLAIGDYLHSMGYSVITACDGPMSFLEIILWSCSWSFLPTSRYEREEAGGVTGQAPPPWIENCDNEHRSWRLPNCIISDIRMPGGIDGVKLLEILRRRAETSTVARDDRPTNGRRKNKTRRRGEYYDEKDDFELLDAIVDGRVNVELEKIITPVDQAIQYVDTIRQSLECFDARYEGAEFSNVSASTYPNTLEKIPVILLTAKAMAADRIEGYKIGANGYLPKPFQPEELLAMLDNLMRRQERERQHYACTKSSSNYIDDRDRIQDFTPDEARKIALDLAEVKDLLIERMRQKQASHKRIEKMQSLLPEASWMLKMGERRKRVFTKEHIKSVLLLRFGIDLKKGSWEAMMNILDEHCEKSE